MLNCLHSTFWTTKPQTADNLYQQQRSSRHLEKIHCFSSKRDRVKNMWRPETTCRSQTQTVRAAAAAAAAEEEKLCWSTDATVLHCSR